MRILILNWRDIKNPSSGGAEILTHEIAKRLVASGHTVIQFSSYFPNASHRQIIDGVTIIREGQPDVRHLFKSVHFLAFKYYQKNPGKFDLVIDEIHGIPFFTPLYVKEKKMTLVCEIADRLWFKVFGKFFGTGGWLVEQFYLKVIYKKIYFLTISESARRSLIKNGVSSHKIEVIPVGVSIPKEFKQVEKEKKQTLIFLGRVTKSKNVEDAIYVLHKLRNILGLQLWIVGMEEKKYAPQLKKVIKEFKLKDRVVFYGFVSERRKFELLSRAWILIHPSKTEGWGINVIEANSVGIPTVGYNVPGLEDSVQNNLTGLLADQNSVEDLTEKVSLLLKDKQLYHKLSRNALIWSKKFEWEKAGRKTLITIKKLYEN